MKIEHVYFFRGERRARRRSRERRRTRRSSRRTTARLHAVGRERRGGYRSGRVFRLFRETIHITNTKTKKQFTVPRAAFFFDVRKKLSREEPPAT
jgi:hypothetical protein